MRLSEKLMLAFVGAVIVAGLFGPYLISIALGATTAIVYAVRRPSRNDRSGAL